MITKEELRDECEAWGLYVTYWYGETDYEETRKAIDAIYDLILQKNNL